MIKQNRLGEALRGPAQEPLAAETELLELFELVERAGRAMRVTFVEDRNSPEGRAAVDYIESHHELLPRDHRATPLEHIVREGERLLDPETPLAEQRRIVMLLAHYPHREALTALRSYRLRRLGPEMATWARMAEQECRECIEEHRTTAPVHGVSCLRSRPRRNEL